MPTIQTPNGELRYKAKALFPGVKLINKEIAKENLLLLKDILDKLGIQFMLSFGTLLGAVREKDFISHDEDIDIILKEEYREKFLGALDKLCDSGFELVRYDRRDLYSIMRKGEYIDFYIYRPYNSELWVSSGYFLSSLFMNEEDVVEFLGRSFRTHSNHIGMLECEYGLDWMTPRVFNNYEMSWPHRAVFKLTMYTRNILPLFLFNYIMKKKDKKKLSRCIRKIEEYRIYKN